jgi:DNA (cytosine-5)-methyltransferase 1
MKDAGSTMETQKHTRPVAIDLFAGAGGLSLGFEQAGFDVVAAVEVDPVHAAVHRFNFPECAVLPRSVVGLTGAEIRAAANLGNRAVDVVFGGAPCQGFSMMGQRALDDPRNSLVGEFVRLVSELRARYFVFENVKGLTLGAHRQFLEELIEAFDKAGYRVRLPWQVLRAYSYGVPQDRQRLILFGARKSLPMPSYPMATTREIGSMALDGLPECPTCEEALGDLPDADRFDTLTRSDAVLTNAWGLPSEYAAELRCEDGRGWHFGYRRKWEPSLLTSSMRTEHSSISSRRFAATHGGETEPISRFYKLPARGISNTLRAGTDSARGAFTSPRPIHYKHPRCVTVREMARLHGYPDWFRFNETKWHGARQIGNSVPPPMARAVASSVIRALGVVPTRPRRILTLGDEALIRMNPSAASRYWGIDNPIARRNMKSGATKRRQEDIEAERLEAMG